MSAFTSFEEEVIDLLGSDVLSAKQKADVVAEAKLVSYEYTGAGYFLTVSHPAFPQARIVCHDPIVMGHADDIDCGFVLFFESGEMMLECHTWGEVEVPEDFRTKQVRLEIRTDVFRG